MCGISGVFHYGDGQPADQAAVDRMNDSLLHRGPDGGGTYLDGPVGLAHRRLSIIDVAGSPQPMFSIDRSVAIVFNGEIYNFLEVRRELESLGARFVTHGDTEVIIAAYQQWGAACVERLRGMFAFAIWDVRKRTLFLARDRLGIKPLYVYDDGSKLLFASELKAIVAHGGAKLSLDPLAVADYFSLLYVPAPRAIFREVTKLPPGHTLQLELLKKPITTRYWQLRVAPDEERSADDWMDELRAKLKEVVDIRLVSEVPLGAFLSGGIDSSAVVATMASLIDRPVSTHSIGFDEKGYDEREFARMVAARYQTDHHEMTVKPDALGIVDTLSWHFDEPFADSSAVPTYYVSKMAREHCTVILSGDGGDENFAGYTRRYLFEQREDRFRRAVPRILRKGVLGTLAKLYPKGDWLPRPLRAKTTLRNLSLDAPDGFWNTMALVDDATRNALFTPDFRGQLDGYYAADLFKKLMVQSGTDDPVARASYVDVHTFMVDDILTKVDRASMAVALEVRVPLIDHVFMEFAAKIPTRLKLDATGGKQIFKKAMEDRLPKEVLYRKKQGFEIPIGEWFRGDLKEMAHDLILAKDGKLDGLFDGERLTTIWNEHQRGQRNWTHMLWALMMFKKWAARFHP